MPVLKSYTTNIKNRTYYTVEIHGKVDKPEKVMFYKSQFTKDDYPSSQKILELTIKNKTDLKLIDEMIKSIKIIKELKPDKD